MSSMKVTGSVIPMNVTSTVSSDGTNATPITGRPVRTPEPPGNIWGANPPRFPHEPMPWPVDPPPHFPHEPLPRPVDPPPHFPHEPLPQPPPFFPRPPIDFPPHWPLPTPQPKPQQTELSLLQAKENANQNPGLDSDTKLLEAARADLKAYQTYEPNSPRVAQLQSMVKELDKKVTGEATKLVDDSLNTWYQSGGTRADNQKLYQALSQAEKALQVSAPHGSELEFVKEARSFVQKQLFPISWPITAF